MPRASHDIYQAPGSAFPAIFIDWARRNDLSHIVTITEAAASDEVEIHFPTTRGCLREHARPTQLEIYADLDGYCWDLLLSLDVVAKAEAGEFVCKICTTEPVHHHETLAELWADQLFAPFGAWLTGNFRRAEAAAFYEAHGSTWAELVPPGWPPPDNARLVSVVPIR